MTLPFQNRCLKAGVQPKATRPVGHFFMLDSKNFLPSGISGVSHHEKTPPLLKGVGGKQVNALGAEA